MQEKPRETVRIEVALAIEIKLHYWLAYFSSGGYHLVTIRTGIVDIMSLRNKVMILEKYKGTA